MIKIIKNTLQLSSLIIISVFFFSYIFFGYKNEIELVFKIILIACLYNILAYIFTTLHLKNYLLEFFMEYVIIIAMVLILGKMFGWFVKSNWWMVFLYTTPVYVFAYILEITHINREVRLINDVLKQNRRKSEENGSNNDEK